MAQRAGQGQQRFRFPAAQPRHFKRRVGAAGAAQLHIGAVIHRTVYGDRMPQPDQRGVVEPDAPSAAPGGIAQDQAGPGLHALRHDPSFPKGANVTFYELEGPGRVFLRTFERGVEDFTWACGTGTGSAVLTLALRGLVRGGADAEMRGGVLRVDVDMAGGKVRNLWLTGPTVVAARGELTEEGLAGICLARGGEHADKCAI